MADEWLLAVCFLLLLKLQWPKNKSVYNTFCLSLQNQFCISIVSSFSWDHCKCQEKIKTMLMQNFGGQTKSIMEFLILAYHEGAFD